MNCYRIVEIKNGKPLSLFHGTNGSRTLPMGKWIEANVKPVVDGSGAKRKYVSGFHVFASPKAACTFFKKMFRNRENRRVICCEASDLRRKMSARGEVYLARLIRITDLTPVTESEVQQE